MTSRLYVTQKFLSLGRAEVSKLYDLYGRLYGRSAQDYFRRTYPKWKSGAVGMSGLTCRRVLECVPRFLSEKELFELALLEIKMRLSSVFCDSNAYEYRRTSSCSLEDLKAEFERRIDVENARTRSLTWFTEKVLSDNECENFNRLANFVVCEYLKNLYEGAVRDLKFVHTIVAHLPYNVSINYRIPTLAMYVELKHDVYLPDKLDVRLTKPSLYTRFDNDIKAFLLECKIEMQKAVVSGDVKRTISALDAREVSRELSRISSADSVESRLTLEGESGILSVRIIKLNLNSLRREVFMLHLWQLATVLATAFVIKLVTEMRRPGGFVLLLAVGLGLAGTWLWSLQLKIRKKQKEITEYGRKNF